MNYTMQPFTGNIPGGFEKAINDRMKNYNGVLVISFDSLLKDKKLFSKFAKRLNLSIITYKDQSIMDDLQPKVKQNILSGPCLFIHPKFNKTMYKLKQKFPVDIFQC